MGEDFFGDQHQLRRAAGGISRGDGKGDSLGWVIQTSFWQDPCLAQLFSMRLTSPVGWACMKSLAGLGSCDGCKRSVTASLAHGMLWAAHILHAAHTDFAACKLASLQEQMLLSRPCPQAWPGRRGAACHSRPAPVRTAAAQEVVVTKPEAVAPPPVPRTLGHLLWIRNIAWELTREGVLQELRKCEPTARHVEVPSMAAKHADHRGFALLNYSENFQGDLEALAGRLQQLGAHFPTWHGRAPQPTSMPLQQAPCRRAMP